MKKKSNKQIDTTINVGDRVGVYFNQDGEVDKLQFSPDNYDSGLIYGKVLSIQNNLYFITWEEDFYNTKDKYYKSVYGRGFEASEVYHEDRIQEMLPQLEQEYHAFEKKMSLKISLVVKAIEELGKEVKSSGFNPQDMYDMVRPLTSSIRDVGWYGSSFEC